MERAFRNVGIDTAEALHALGPDDAYLRLLKGGHRPHFIGYYAMVMGLQGRPWNDCRGAEKDALRRRFDALVSRAAAARAPDSEMERHLDEMGIRPARMKEP